MRHFKEFAKTVGYDEFVGTIEYIGGIYNEYLVKIDRQAEEIVLTEIIYN